MFQRMVAIPQEEYMKLTSVQQVRQPYTQQFYNLEKQYGEQEYIRDPYQRMLMQSETLEDMKELKERMRQDLTLATPKPYRSRALALYQSLQPFLKFNERGEIFNENGQVVPQSRLEDLVQYAVRDRRRAVVPTGWSQFRDLLQSQNVPKYMLNRDTLQEMTNVNVKIESTTPLKLKVRAKSESPPRKRGRSHKRRSHSAGVRKRQSSSANTTRKRSISAKRININTTRIPTPIRQSGRTRRSNTKFGDKYGFVKNY